MHKSSFKLEHKRTSTKLSDHVWKLKKKTKKTSTSTSDERSPAPSLNKKTTRFLEIASTGNDSSLTITIQCSLMRFLLWTEILSLDKLLAKCSYQILSELLQWSHCAFKVDLKQTVRHHSKDYNSISGLTWTTLSMGSASRPRVSEPRPSIAMMKLRKNSGSFPNITLEIPSMPPGDQ